MFVQISEVPQHPATTGVPSMTITRFFAAIKCAQRSSDQIRDHYEYLTSFAKNSPSLKRFLQFCQVGTLVELRISHGNDSQKTAAREIAESLNMDFDKLVFPSKNNLLVVLRVPSQFKVIKTESIQDNSFVEKVKLIMPWAIRFEIVQWFKCGENIVGERDRVPYQCSQFGYSPNGLPK